MLKKRSGRTRTLNSGLFLATGLCVIAWFRVASFDVLAQDENVLVERETVWKASRDRFERWYHGGLDLPGDGAGSVVDWEQSKLDDLRETARQLDDGQSLENARVLEWLRVSEVDRRAELEDGTVIELQSIRKGVVMFDTTMNQIAATTVGTSGLFPGGKSGLGLSGAGTVFGIWDAGDIRKSHQEFDGSDGIRITDRDGVTPNGISDHSTHVAGTLVARGLDVTAKGMSYEASLDAYDWTDDLVEMGNAADPANPNHLLLSNHSYGRVTGWAVISVNGVPTWAWIGDIAISTNESFYFGFYSERSQAIDAIVYDAIYYLPVWAASNERGSIGQAPSNQPVTHAVWENGVFKYTGTLVHPDDGDEGGFDTLVQQSVAKNVLTVGAVQDILNGYQTPSDVVMTDFSGFGPTDDGRIKPDIVGSGQTVWSTGSSADDFYRLESGTSMATANVTGSLNLLVQRFEQLYGSENPMWASTLRGLAVHCADEAGDADGPDYKHGWGLLNTSRAAELLDANFASGSLAHIKEVSLIDGEFIEFPVVSDGTQPLRVTICWTDPEGTPPPDEVDPQDLMLVNDLDLRILKDANVFQPWVLDPTNPADAATTGDNFRDNVEQVVIAEPPAGDYVVRVTHKGNLVDDAGTPSLQNVSVFVSGNTAQDAPELAITSAAVTGPDEISLLWPAVVGLTYQVRFKDELDEEHWTNIGPQINASRSQVAVALPAPGGAAHRFFQVVEVE